VGEEVQERVGSEFDQSTLYTKMEISQWNFFVQLIYANKIMRKLKFTTKLWYICQKKVMEGRYEF
jgi:hypothetical protein